MANDFSPTSYPIIRIKYARFLDPVFEIYVKTKPRWKKWIKPDTEKIKRSIESARSAWEKKEKTIIKTMCETMSLNFSQNMIDVYVVSGNDRSFSDPIVIRNYSKPEDFVDELAHELTHRLMADNAQSLDKPRMSIVLKKAFPEEPGDIRNHMQTYAVLKRIFVDVLKDDNWTERTLKKITDSPHPEYKQAWDKVEEIGYMKVIETIKNKRASLS